MSDDSVVPGGSGDAPIGDTPADGGGEPADFATELAQIEAEVAGEVASTRTDEGEGDEGGKPQAPPQATPDELDLFIQKNYGGDRAAFIAAQYNSRTEAQRLAEENRALKERLNAPPAVDPKVALQRAREQSSELQSLNQEVTAIDSQIQQIGNRQQQLTQIATKLDGEINRLEGELVKADDSERYRIYSDLNLKRNQLSSLNNEFLVNEGKIELRQTNRSRIIRDMQEIDRNLRDEMAAEEEQRHRGKSVVVRTNQQFSSAFDSLTENLDLTDESRMFLRETVRTQLADYLDSLGDAEGLDAGQLRDMSARIIASARKHFGIKERSAAVPRTTSVPRPVRVPAARPVVSGARPAAPSPANEDLMNDPKYVRQRAARVFEAMNRRSNRG